MMFCPNCGNMLIVEKHTGVNFLTCLSCPYHYEIKNRLFKKYPNEMKKLEGVFGGKDELMYASTCTKKCIKCPSETAMYMEIQIRSADEPMTIFYECIQCRTTWKE